jgi:sugar lactone lactonase YvrE
MRPPNSLCRRFAPFVGLLISFATLVTAPSRADEPPAASWATFVSATNSSVFSPRLLAAPSGGFYLYSASERPLIKFNSDGSIAWEIRFQRGVNEVRQVVQLDTLGDGDLIAIISTTSNPRLFGQQFTADGTYLVRLRANDGSAVFVQACDKCALTAVKARPGGGYFVAGFSWAAPRIGESQLPIAGQSIFVSQFSAGLDWTVTGKGPLDAVNYMIGAIRTTGSGDALRIYLGGDAAGAWTFGSQTIAQAGAFLIIADATAQALRAETVAPLATFAALETTPNGGVNFAANTATEGLLKRIEADGTQAWTTTITNMSRIAAVTGTDEPYVAGSASSSTTTALDSAGNVKWQRIEARRSFNQAEGIALLADGRLALCGRAHSSGMFIDDFFVNNLGVEDLSILAAFLAVLETRADAAPVFRVQPRHQKFALRGETVTLHSEVFSPTGATFVWYKDGKPIPGETSSDLILPKVQGIDRGIYYVEAQNGFGVTRSQSIDVVVNSIKVTTVAGTEAAGVFEVPVSPIILPDGSIVVADRGQHVIKRVTASGVTTYAGTGQAGLVNGLPTEAQFSAPNSLALESRLMGPSVYVADRGNNAIRRIRFSTQTGEAQSVDQINRPFAGIVSVSALDGLPYVFGGSESTVWRIEADEPIDLNPGLPTGPFSAMAVDMRGDVYLAERVLGQIYRRTTGGQIDQLGAANDPSGLALDESGNIYVTERGTHTILKISPHGATTLVTGGLNAPEGLCWRGNSLIVADTGNHCLRELKFEPAQDVVISDANIAISIGDLLELTVTGSAGEQYEVESCSSVDVGAVWQSEGSITIDVTSAKLLLPKRDTTRFFRARYVQ